MRHSDALDALDAMVDADLSTPAMNVYKVLIIRTDNDGVCWPSINRMARETGHHPGTVRRAVRELSDAGLCLTDLTEGGPPDATNLYRLPVKDVHTPRGPRGVTTADPAWSTRQPRVEHASTPRGPRDERLKKNGEENAASPTICPLCDEPVIQLGKWRHPDCVPR